MPYIDPKRRFAVLLAFYQKEGEPTLAAGDLNYALSNLVDDYLIEAGVSYESLNTVMGVLTCMQQEIGRRVLAPLEDKKLAKHGEVFFSAI